MRAFRRDHAIALNWVVHRRGNSQGFGDGQVQARKRLTTAATATTISPTAMRSRYPPLCINWACNDVAGDVQILHWIMATCIAWIYP